MTLWVVYVMDRDAEYEAPGGIYSTAEAARAAVDACIQEHRATGRLAKEPEPWRDETPELDQFRWLRFVDGVLYIVHGFPVDGPLMEDEWPGRERGG